MRSVQICKICGVSAVIVACSSGPEVSVVYDHRGGHCCTPEPASERHVASLAGEALSGLAGWESLAARYRVMDKAGNLSSVEVFNSAINSSGLLQEMQRLTLGPAGRCSSFLCRTEGLGSRSAFNFEEARSLHSHVVPTSLAAFEFQHCKYERVSDTTETFNEFIGTRNTPAATLVLSVKGSAVSDSDVCWDCGASVVECLDRAAATLSSVDCSNQVSLAALASGFQLYPSTPKE